MRVLFVGQSSGQPLLMQNAMKRRGHEVVAVDPYVVLHDLWPLKFWAWHTGGWLISKRAERHICRSVGERLFDVAFVDCGDLVSPGSVQFLRERAKGVVLFTRDNPFVSRDGLRWRTLLAALPLYDLYVTRRASTANEAPHHGAREVMQVTLFADEVLHKPGAPSSEEYDRYGSPVSFVGTWFPERGAFVETLIRRGVPLKIVGHRWSRAPNFSFFKNAVVPGYLTPEQYAAAVRSSRIAVGMLSKGNQDLHTARSLEIPAMGVVFCAERTEEHVQMYSEGQEAVFWSDADECAAQCLELLSDPERCNRIAAAGRARVLKSEHWTEPTMEKILLAAQSIRFGGG